MGNTCFNNYQENDTYFKNRYTCDKSLTVMKGKIRRVKSEAMDTNNNKQGLMSFR